MLNGSGGSEGTAARPAAKHLQWRRPSPSLEAELMVGVCPARIRMGAPWLLVARPRLLGALASRAFGQQRGATHTGGSAWPAPVFLAAPTRAPLPGVGAGVLSAQSLPCRAEYVCGTLCACAWRWAQPAKLARAGAPESAPKTMEEEVEMVLEARAVDLDWDSEHLCVWLSANGLYNEFIEQNGLGARRATQRCTRTRAHAHARAAGRPRRWRAVAAPCCSSPRPGRGRANRSVLACPPCRGTGPVVAWHCTPAAPAPSSSPAPRPLGRLGRLGRLRFMQRVRICSS